MTSNLTLSLSISFFRLPSDVLEKMPSASNSPMTPRRRRSRISSLLQQKKAVVAAAEEAETATQLPFEKSPSPVMDKFRQQG